MSLSRLEKIKKYIKEKTTDIISSGDLKQGGIDAINCSLDLHLDRANVSKDMNTLWKTGDLIKIQGKPVYYLDYHVLLDAFPDSYFPSVIGKNEKITNYLNYKNKDSDSNIEQSNPLESIDNLIGARGSISDVILNAKSAVAYPPYGIHCLISGNHGVGKSYLTMHMHEYAKTIKKNDALPFMSLYCQNYEDNPSLFYNALYGSVSSTGKKGTISIFEQCENGIVVFEQIEHLPYSCQNMLSSIISQKQYLPANSASIKQLNTMIIVTTNLNTDDSRIETIAHTIPIHLHLRDIDQRGVYEKIELILSLISQEALHTKKAIRIHKDIIALFAMKKYPNNISDMRNEIQIACSKAYLSNSNLNQNTIYITYQSLSLEMLKLTEEASNMSSSIISLLSCIPTDYLQFNEDGSSPSMQIFQKAPTMFNNHRISQFIEEFNINVDDLDDIENYVSENIAVLKNCPEAQLQGLRKAINPYVLQITLLKLQERTRNNLLQNNSQLLYGILLHITNYLKRIQNDDVETDKSNQSVTEMVYHDEFLIAKDIYNTLGKTYGFIPSNREIDFLATYLAIANQWANHTNVAILVICHGNSIASELVNYVKNSIKGNYIIDSINYTPTMQINDCLELACIKATNINNGAGVLVVCDNEPLTSIGDYIYKETGIPSRTIPDITLSSLIHLVQQSMTAINSLDTLAANYKPSKKTNTVNQNDFIEQIREKIISRTVNFIDTKKAVSILKNCLENTLNDFSIPYSDALAVKYICHCTNMLERIIRNEPWDYLKIGKFYNDNTYIMHVIEHRLEYAGNSFGIKIPTTEIAYIAEIFLPEIKSNINNE